ncbi:hypothetical protein [Paraflavitalea pollutisoli]|uniref:hypothetical protein n=1 Tax=Paraflavitalea pollutisoli TaxID=3034143 RepID=UPI0023EB94E4|nr:hypothetical protein [Paraflavitalea sp. H1-2-19X]
MKKVFFLATMALLMSSAVAYSNEGEKNKQKTGKGKTENCCKKTCTKPGKPCCEKPKCTKS